MGKRKKKFWVCISVYRGSGRVSSCWVEKNINNPAEWRPCNPEGVCECTGNEGGNCGNDNQHIPYPFNDMGGRVVAGPFRSYKKADRWSFRNIIWD